MKQVELLRKQKRLLRVALTQVKVDHLNKKVKLSVATHALIENTLADTASGAEPRRRPIRKGLPVFEFKRHRSPKAILREFTKDSGWKLEDISVGTTVDGYDLSADEMAGLIERQGLWGFAETHAKPPVIHFWHDGKRSEASLMQFFGHEMGHTLGEALEDDEAEEFRADDYGHVAVLAAKAARKACRDS
jgi:hypothetical protein